MSSAPTNPKKRGRGRPPKYTSVEERRKHDAMRKRQQRQKQKSTVAVPSSTTQPVLSLGNEQFDRSYITRSIHTVVLDVAANPTIDSGLHLSIESTTLAVAVNSTNL